MAVAGGLGYAQAERTLFPQRPVVAFWRKHPEPDRARIQQELQTHKDLTLQLVWQEGRENHPEGYGYRRSLRPLPALVEEAVSFFSDALWQLFPEIERKPRVWRCQPVGCMISSSVAPVSPFSMSIRMAFLPT